MVNNLPKPRIYIKLPTGIWVEIKGKLKRVIASKTKSGKTRRTISYSLIGESLDDEPKIRGTPTNTFYISSTRVTKYILKILDEEMLSTVIIVIKPITKEIYEVNVYNATNKIIDKIKGIAEEMKIVRQPSRKKQIKGA